MNEYFEEIFHTRDKTEPSEYAHASDAILESELHVVFKAGTQHPKNYPAWDYARAVVNLLKTNRLPRHGVPDVSKALDQTHAWCLNHPTDTSGWSFLCFLFSQTDLRCDLGRQLVQKTIDTTLDFRWASEAVWSFLRVSIASDKCLSPACRKTLIERLERCMTELQQISASHTYAAESSVAAESVKLLLHRVNQALHWIRTNYVCTNFNSQIVTIDLQEQSTSHISVSFKNNYS